jgi:hypothetical protein
MDSSFDVSTTLLDAKIVNQKASNVSPSLAESCLGSETRQSNANQTNSCTENFSLLTEVSICAGKRRKRDLCLDLTLPQSMIQLRT